MDEWWEESRVGSEISAGLWGEDALTVVWKIVEVSTDPADDDTDHDPWLDRPFTADELEAIQSVGVYDTEW